jgi:hypothetical protein
MLAGSRFVADALGRAGKPDRIDTVKRMAMDADFSDKGELAGPEMVQTFAGTGRERIRIDDGGYRRDHLCALAQRVEVANREVRIVSSGSNLLQTLTAAAGIKPAARSPFCF